MTSRATLYDELKAALAANQPAGMVTIVRGPGVGSNLLVRPDDTLGSLGDAAFDAEVAATARELVAAERSETRTLTGPAGEIDLFFESFAPAPLLVIFGAVHVGQALCRFASQVGYRVIVTDARAKLATAERFPEADQIIQAWPDEAFAQVPFDDRSVIAILSHDPKFDEPAILGALETPARYIGAVGSRKTNQDRRERLRAAGVSEHDLQRVRGPIGLDLGGGTPEEMAISILAEIIATRYGRGGGSLTGAEGRIRASS